jgi:protein ImuB
VKRESTRVAVVDVRGLPAEQHAALAHRLLGLSPRVEPDPERPGVFFLDPSGMDALFGTLPSWARRVHRALREEGLDGSVVVGFSRFPAWAAARAREGVRVFRSPAEEQTFAREAPLSLLELGHELERALRKLGVESLGGFLDLPRGEVSTRFGARAKELHALFEGALRPPLEAFAEDERVFVEAELEVQDAQVERLVFCIKGALHTLLAELGRRGLSLSRLDVRFELEWGEPILIELEPAHETRDALMLLELARLRLASVEIRAPVQKLSLEAKPCRLEGRQLTLFDTRAVDPHAARFTRRVDPDAAARGLSRLRASFGDESVTRAILEDAWLPERSFSWEPITTVARPRARGDEAAPLLVRRVQPSPRSLPTSADGKPRTDPPICALAGPYRLQGGFWRGEQARDYFYAERTDGSLLFLYRDLHQKRWFLQGALD